MTSFSEDLWQQWIKKEREVFAKGQRSYLHFDRKINFEKSLPKLKKFLRQPEEVAKHDFYPLIRRVNKALRYRQVEGESRKIKVKKRPICYTAHFDTLIYSWYAFLLANRYEAAIQKEGIQDCVSAYRRIGKSNVDFALEAFEAIQNRGACAAIALDVKGFFDHLDHNHLKKSWASLLAVERLPPDHYTLYQSLSKFSYANRNTLLKQLRLDLKEDSKSIRRLCDPTTYRVLRKQVGLIRVNPHSYGIPQGAAISAVLSNIYMMEFDKKVNDLAAANNLYYRRYCDDILLVCQPVRVNWLKELICEKIGSYGLKINADKAEIVYFGYRSPEHEVAKDLSINMTLTVPHRRLQYLGFEFDGRNIYIRPSSLARYYRKMKKGVKQTVKRAFGNNALRNKVYEKKLRSRFTHLGKHNFISYSLSAFRKMRSETIRQQIASHGAILENNIKARTSERVLRQNVIQLTRSSR